MSRANFEVRVDRDRMIIDAVLLERMSDRVAYAHLLDVASALTMEIQPYTGASFPEVERDARRIRVKLREDGDIEGVASAFARYFRGYEEAKTLVLVEAALRVAAELGLTAGVTPEPEGGITVSLTFGRVTFSPRGSGWVYATHGATLQLSNFADVVLEAM